MSLSEIKSLAGTPWAILLAVFFLCASIIIHELGHFLAAKWRGLVVERFSIGFGPRLFGWSRNGVDYRVSAIPLGGYVALPQLAGVRGLEGGESAYEADKLPPLSVMDKIIVSLAGPIFNILFAVVLGLVIWMTGRPVDASQRTTTIGYVARELVQDGGTKIPGPAWEAGLRPGDKLTAIDGKIVGEWTEVAQSIATGSSYSGEGARMTELTIVRNGQELKLSVNPVLDSTNGLREIGILPATPAVIGEVFPNSPALRAGLKKGDRIVEIDGEPIGHIFAAGKIISKLPPEAHTMKIQRGGALLLMTLTPELADVGGGEPRPMIGIRWAAEDKVVVHENPFVQVSNVIYMTFDVLKALVNPKSDISVKDMSGPVGIAHALFISAQESLSLLLFLVIFINVNLAIVNLLPIPVLDGGHIAFAIVEKLLGKPLPPRFLAASQMIFMILLFGMMAYITLQDIGREVDMARARREISASEKAPDPVFPATPEADGQAEAKAPEAVPAK
jgi:regulator of sigma E protease